MIASTAALRQAAGLVDLAAEGKLAQHTGGLIEVARANPVRAAELIVALAETIIALQPGSRPGVVVPDPDPREVAPDVDPLQAYLRRAHSAFANGSRAPWAVQGEREYQRLKKRAQRARTRAGLRAAS